MSTDTSIPKDLSDHIRDVLGKRRVNMKKRLNCEVKPDKYEGRILVLTDHRFYLFSMKVPPKVELNINYMELEAIRSTDKNSIQFRAGGRTYTLQTLDREDADDIIVNIALSLQSVFPVTSVRTLIGNFIISPDERLEMIDKVLDLQSQCDHGPCGGFSSMYRYLCDYHKSVYKEDVAWDVDTIYSSHNNKDMNLRDFDHLPVKDLIPILGTLQFSTWFEKLTIRDIRLALDCLDELIKVVSTSTNLSELVLSGLGLKSDYIQKLSSAISGNPTMPLVSIDLSNNPIDDRGVGFLSETLLALPSGLVSLNLQQTSISSKSLSGLCRGFTENQFTSDTLVSLNLSSNSLRGDEIAMLYNFLARPNVLTELNLSNCDFAFESIFGALHRGSSLHLAYIDLSGNSFSKRSKDYSISPSVITYFSTVASLKWINLSDSKLPPDALKHILNGLVLNETLQDLHLNISNNDLRFLGAQVIQSVIMNIKAISHFDISNNGLDSDIINLVEWLKGNDCIKHLAIGDNFNTVSKNRGQLMKVLDAIVHLIQAEDSAITSLSLANSKLRSDTAIIINALGSNKSLSSIDISGNLMGDICVKMLSKALQINHYLRTIIWDKNGTTADGFMEIVSALENNYRVTEMPIPIFDVSNAMRYNNTLTEEAVRKIESILIRNHSPHTLTSDHAYRLQHGFLTSTAQQLVNKVAVQVRDNKKFLCATKQDQFTDYIEEADQILIDGEKCKQVFCLLHDVSLKANLQETIDNNLKTFNTNLYADISTQLESCVENMLQSVVSQCPSTLETQEVSHDLRDICKLKGSLDKDYLYRTVVEQVGAELSNKLNEITLSVASSLSDRVIDEVLERLTKHNNHMKEEIRMYRRTNIPALLVSAIGDSRAPTPVDDEPTVSKSTSPPSMKTEGQSEATPGVIAVKRKSLHGRMLRPKSVLDPEAVSYRSELDMQVTESESSSQHVTFNSLAEEPDETDSNSKHDIEFQFSVSQIIPVPQLSHITVNRPRKPKPNRSSHHRPSRPVRPTTDISITSITEDTDNNTTDNLKIDEGFDEFFKISATTNTSAQPVQTNDKHPTSKQRPVSNTPKESKLKKEKKSLSSLFSRFHSRSSKSEETLKDSSIKKHSHSTSSNTSSSTVPPDQKIRSKSQPESRGIDETDIDTGNGSTSGSEVKEGVHNDGPQTDLDCSGDSGLVKVKPQGVSENQPTPLKQPTSPVTPGIPPSPGQSRRTPFLGISVMKGSDLLAELRQRTQSQNSDEDGLASSCSDKQSTTNLKPLLQKKTHMSPKMGRGRHSPIPGTSSPGDLSVNMTLSPSTDSGIGVPNDVDNTPHPTNT